MAFSERAKLELADGSTLVALAGNNNARIVQRFADGTETVLSNQKTRKSKSQNTKLVLDEFNLIKDAFEAAGKGEELTYDADNINPGSGGFLRTNKPSTLDLSGDITIGSKMGNAGTEASNINNYLNAINAVAVASKSDDVDIDDDTDDDADDDTDDDTPSSDEFDRLDTADEIVEKSLDEELDIDLGDTPEAEEAEEALDEVGDGLAASTGGDIVGDLDQSTDDFTDPDFSGEPTDITEDDIDDALDDAGDADAISGTSILTSVPASVQTVSSNTALGGEMEADAAISVGPAEDDAIEYYTKGRRASILTRPGGLLTASNVDEDPRLRRRRSLLAG